MMKKMTTRACYLAVLIIGTFGYLYVAGICGNHAFPEMPRQLLGGQAFSTGPN